MRGRGRSRRFGENFYIFYYFIFLLLLNLSTSVRSYLFGYLNTVQLSHHSRRTPFAIYAPKSARSTAPGPVITLPFTATPPCGVKVQISHFPSPVRAPQNVTGS